MRFNAFLLVLGALIAVGFSVVAAIPAGPAHALPSYSSSCSGCHVTSAQVNVTVTQANATTWSFTITGPFSGPSGYGVFDAGGTKVASGLAGSGSFAIANPSGTYTFYGVDKDPNSLQGLASTQFAAAAPATATPTRTAVPPTATTTSAPAAPTATPTSAPAAPTATPTRTPIGPTATPTTAPVGPTATPTNPPPPTGAGPSAVIGTKHDLGSAGNPACNKCHTPHDAAGRYLWARSVGTGGGIQPLCYSCHDGSVTSTGKYAFDASRAQHPTTPGAQGADCDRCHNPHVGTFKFTTVSQPNADLCQSCHGKTGSMNHPVDVLDSNALPSDRGWDPNAATPDFSGARLYNSAGTTQVASGPGYVKCLTCHSPHGGTSGTALNTMATSSATNSTAPLCQNCHR